MQNSRSVAASLLAAAAAAAQAGGAYGARFAGTALPLALVRGLSHDAEERKRWELLKSQGHKVNP